MLNIQNQVKSFSENKLRAIRSLLQYRHHNENVYPSLNTLARAASVSLSSIKRYLDEFKDLNLVCTKRRGFNKSLNFTIAPELLTREFAQRLRNLLKQFHPTAYLPMSVLKSAQESVQQGAELLLYIKDRYYMKIFPILLANLDVCVPKREKWIDVYRQWEFYGGNSP